jgi:hypothetical protein
LPSTVGAQHRDLSHPGPPPLPHGASSPRGTGYGVPDHHRCRHHGHHADLPPLYMRPTAAARPPPELCADPPPGVPDLATGTPKSHQGCCRGRALIATLEQPQQTSLRTSPAAAFLAPTRASGGVLWQRRGRGSPGGGGGCMRRAVVPPVPPREGRRGGRGLYVC